MNNIGLKIYLLGDLEPHDHSDIFLLGVNQSGPKMNSTTNHKFYRALELLHGPWCKEPLMVASHLSSLF